MFYLRIDAQTKSILKTVRTFVFGCDKNCGNKTFIFFYFQLQVFEKILHQITLIVQEEETFCHDFFTMRLAEDTNQSTIANKTTENTKNDMLISSFRCCWLI
jgi:hypothetical protein